MTCPERAGRRKNKPRSFRILLQKRFSQHSPHVRPKTPVCWHCSSPSIPGSKPASGSAWVQVGPDACTKMCLSPILTMSTGAAVSCCSNRMLFSPSIWQETTHLANPFFLQSSDGISDGLAWPLILEGQESMQANSIGPKTVSSS